MKPEDYCAALEKWAELYLDSENELRPDMMSGLRAAFNTIRLAVSKSCLLDRLIYGGEKVSQTPCPVHKGRWSGIQVGWPGQKWSNGEDVEVSPMLQKWYDEGCRCFKHSCGCTTGWQPE